MSFIPEIIICYTSKTLGGKIITILTRPEEPILVTQENSKFLIDWVVNDEIKVVLFFMIYDLNYQSLLICNIFYPFFLYI